MDKLSGLERYGVTGWRWEIEWDRGNFTVTIFYRTNREGDGLFSMSEDDSAYRQSKGALQWGLPYSEQRARQRISRHFGVKWSD